jgi:hypothetical protein
MTAASGCLRTPYLGAMGAGDIGAGAAPPADAVGVHKQFLGRAIRTAGKQLQRPALLRAQAVSSSGMAIHRSRRRFTVIASRRRSSLAGRSGRC